MQEMCNNTHMDEKYTKQCRLYKLSMEKWRKNNRLVFLGFFVQYINKRVLLILKLYVTPFRLYFLVQVTHFRICIRLNAKSSLSKACFLRHSNNPSEMSASVLFITFKPSTPHSYNCNNISANCVNK